MPNESQPPNKHQAEPWRFWPRLGLLLAISLLAFVRFGPREELAIGLLVWMIPTSFWLVIGHEYGLRMSRYAARTSHRRRCVWNLVHCVLPLCCCPGVGVHGFGIVGAFVCAVWLSPAAIAELLLNAANPIHQIRSLTCRTGPKQGR